MDDELLLEYDLCELLKRRVRRKHAEEVNEALRLVIETLEQNHFGRFELAATRIDGEAEYFEGGHS
jgi:hypothetical protein